MNVFVKLAMTLAVNPGPTIRDMATSGSLISAVSSYVDQTGKATGRSLKASPVGRSPIPL